jgi:hypothetical protein
MRIPALICLVVAGCVPKEPAPKPTRIVFDRQFRDIIRPAGQSRNEDQLAIDIGACTFVIDLQPRGQAQSELLLESCMKGKGWTLFKRTPRVEEY